MKERTVIAHKLVFKKPKQTEIRTTSHEEIDKEPLNVEYIEFRQRFGVVNKFRLICSFINDSYVGFDQEIPLEFEVVQDDPERVIADYDKED